jgi:hypothetical protein
VREIGRWLIGGARHKQVQLQDLFLRDEARRRRKEEKEGNFRIDKRIDEVGSLIAKVFVLRVVYW